MDCFAQYCAHKWVQEVAKLFGVFLTASVLAKESECI